MDKVYRVYTNTSKGWEMVRKCSSLEVGVAYAKSLNVDGRYLIIEHDPSQDIDTPVKAGILENKELERDG